MTSNIAEDFIATLDSPSKIKTSQAVFTKLSDYAQAQNTSIEDIISDPLKLDDFKVFLKKNLSKPSLKAYVSLLRQIENWFNQRSDTSQLETPKPDKEAVTPKSSTIKARQCDRLNITLTPYYDQKKKKYYVDCPQDIFKKDRYGHWIPTGKIRGEVTEEYCNLCNQRYQAWLERKKRKETEKQEVIKEEPEPELQPELKLEPAVDLKAIAEADGVCLNPISMRQKHPLACHLCKLQKPNHKWQACQEIQEELKHPIAYAKFVNNMIEKTKEHSLPNYFEDTSQRSGVDPFIDKQVDEFIKSNPHYWKSLKNPPRDYSMDSVLQCDSLNGQKITYGQCLQQQKTNRCWEYCKGLAKFFLEERLGALRDFSNGVN